MYIHNFFFLGTSADHRCNGRFLQTVSTAVCHTLLYRQAVTEVQEVSQVPLQFIENCKPSAAVSTCSLIQDLCE